MRYFLWATPIFLIASGFVSVILWLITRKKLPWTTRDTYWLIILSFVWPMVTVLKAQLDWVGIWLIQFEWFKNLYSNNMAFQNSYVWFAQHVKELPNMILEPGLAGLLVPFVRFLKFFGQEIALVRLLLWLLGGGIVIFVWAWIPHMPFMHG
jgi:hypothetical protein